MLQPSQLEDVSVRYADEIAEVREFFTTAGIPVGMPQALGQVAARLREDRGFHRDLTSHVWVMLHRRGPAVRYGETLGVVAVAAAGKHLAASAEEGVAHHLLRFVMEAHDGLNPPVRSAVAAETRPVAPVIPMRPVREVAEASVVDPVPPAEAGAPSPVLVPLPVRAVPVAEDPVAPVETLPTARPALDTPIRLTRVDAASAEEHEGQRKSLVWVALVASLLLALAVGWWMHRRASGPETATTPAPVVEGTAAAPAEPAPAVVVAPEQPAVETSSGVSQPTPPTRAVTPSHPHAAQHRPELVPSYPAPAVVAKSTDPAPAAPTSVATSTRPAAAATAPTAAPIVRSSASAPKAAPATVPSNVLSKQLDRPGLTKEQEAEYDATGRRYPRLLRRTPAGTTQMAANTVPAMPGLASRAGSAPAGVVRPTSLGVMASNLVYSPAASYPAAASAAHVEGAVKVEAVVDTAGNVAAARVISGPPQLRDAALNAVQQWRYRPYVLGGKARTFTTQALMEFELP